MKIPFQKTKIALVMFAFITVISCNEKSGEISPSLNDAMVLAEAPITDQKAAVITRLRKDKDFKELNRMLDEIETQIINGQFKPLISEKNAVNVWKSKLSNAKNEKTVYSLLSEMYNEYQLLINVQKASSKFFDTRNINTKYPELARFSKAQKIQVFSEVFPNSMSLKNARGAVESDSQCAGTCSSQLNIELSGARIQLWIDSLSAAYEGDISGVFSAFMTYVNTFNTAISSFENCYNGC